MTEASPVTHVGFLLPELYKPDSVGAPVVQTECRIVDEKENDVAPGEIGELVMRGPQFMLGYWKSPDASAAVLRDGWYWSGDIVRVDDSGQYYVVDRRKEMMKYKGFSIAPAEVESVLLEHPAVRDCGVVSRVDSAGEEIPCAFVVGREAGAHGVLRGVVVVVGEEEEEKGEANPRRENCVFFFVPLFSPHPHEG